MDHRGRCEQMRTPPLSPSEIRKPQRDQDEAPHSLRPVGNGAARGDHPARRVLIGTRLIGEREIGQTAPFDLILLRLRASVAPNVMTGPNISVTGGLTATATLFVPQWEHAPDTASARTLAMDRGVPHTRGSPFSRIERVILPPRLGISRATTRPPSSPVRKRLTTSPQRSTS